MKDVFMMNMVFLLIGYFAGIKVHAYIIAKKEKRDK